MIKNSLEVIVRFILTSALLYGVYTETGIWTGLAFFLVFIALEFITAILIKKSRA